jgi:WD40 repeat protein
MTEEEEKNSRSRQVFISYARADDEPFVKRLYDDLEQNGIRIWWDREKMESRGRLFLQEIRDAISESDRVLLVVGPSAIKSPYVRAEWEHALLFSKAVVPLLRIGESKDIPSEVPKVHRVDFRSERNYEDALNELLRILATPIPPLSSLTNIPQLPPHFLVRREEIAAIANKVLIDLKKPQIITHEKQSTAVTGMGGLGKSVIAAAFARSREARTAFKDGIIWLSIGQKPDLLSNIKILGFALGDKDPGNYLDLEIAKKIQLPRILENKNCLITLDDVWDKDHVEHFRDALGPKCRLLITTRDRSIATSLGAQEYLLGMLDESQALFILAEWCEKEVDSLPPEAKEIAKECGYLPFALSLCGAMVRDGSMWSDLLGALKEADLTFIEKDLPNYREYTTILKSMKVSVDALAVKDSTAAECYKELVVFYGKAVPEAAVITYWLHRFSGLTERNARSKILPTLASKSLLRLDGEDPNQRISLHDLQRDYLQAIVGNMKILHGMLLEAYAKRCSNEGWTRGPNDGYFFERLAYHLYESGRKDELRQTLLSFDWIETKLDATDANSLIDDYAYVSKEDKSSFLLLVQSALRLSAHVLNRDKRQLRSQLYGRLLGLENEYAEVRQLLERIRKNGKESKTKPWIRLLTSTLELPGGPLLWTLAGHSGGVTSVAVTPDGKHAVSGSSDNTLRLWNLETGQEMRKLEGHTDNVTSVAITPDGRKAISGSYDKTVIVWDLATGNMLGRLQGHADSITSIVVTPDSSKIISGADTYDSTLKVWNLETVNMLAIHSRNHTASVSCIEIIPNQKRAISGSQDKTIKIWDLESGQLLDTFEGHKEGILKIIVSPDGSEAVSQSWDAAKRTQGLIVWDLNNGKRLHEIDGYNIRAITPDGRKALFSLSGNKEFALLDLETGKRTGPILVHGDNALNIIAITPDGCKAISESTGGELKEWDLATGKLVFTLKGHTGYVDSVAITPDGKRAVSGSYDKTVRVWNLENGSEVKELVGHTGEVYLVAITPDGKRAVSTSRDKTLKVWDLETGENIHTLKSDSEGINNILSLPNGHIVFSSMNRTLNIWDPDKEEIIARFTGESPIGPFAARKDGTIIVAGEFSGRVHILSLEFSR